MKRLFSGIGAALLTILKWISLIMLGVLRLGLEFAKTILVLFGLVLRVFLAFVRAGTP